MSFSTETFDSKDSITKLLDNFTKLISIVNFDRTQQIELHLTLAECSVKILISIDNAINSMNRRLTRRYNKKSDITCGERFQNLLNDFEGKLADIVEVLDTFSVLIPADLQARIVEQHEKFKVSVDKLETDLNKLAEEVSYPVDRNLNKIIKDLIKITTELSYIYENTNVELDSSLYGDAFKNYLSRIKRYIDDENGDDMISFKDDIEKLDNYLQSIISVDNEELSEFRKELLVCGSEFKDKIKELTECIDEKLKTVINKRLTSVDDLKYRIIQLEENKDDLEIVHPVIDRATMEFRNIEITAEFKEWLIKTATEGNSFAQYYLARLYTEGHGFEKDEKEGYKWYKLSANQGNSDAQVSVALKYKDRDDEEYNPDRAYNIIIKNASKGNPRAQRCLEKFMEDDKIFLCYLNKLCLIEDGVHNMIKVDH